MDSESWDVKVYIYDLSRGLAKAMSQALLGKQLEGIWHTGIVVYGQEFYFGGTGGIEYCPPGGTILGQPTTIGSLGKTQIPYEMFMDYLHDLSQSSFRPDTYHLLDHNCNTFSSEVAQFLTGNDIPAVITGLPAEVLSTPFGQMIRPFIDAMSVNPSGGHALFPETSQFQSNQSKTRAPPSQYQANQPKSRDQVSQSKHSDGASPKKSTNLQKGPDGETLKPFVFKNACPEQSYWNSSDLGLSSAEQNHLKEVYEFLEHDDATWSLGRDHMSTLHRLVIDCDTACEKSSLQILCRLVQKEDILQLLSHDPKSKFPEILQKFENYTCDVRSHILKMLCNCSSLASGHSLLEGKHRQRITNICVSSLLEDDPDILSAAIALSYNLSLRKLSEDTELELGSALLNGVEKDTDEQTAYHLLSAIVMLMRSSEEVKGLAGVLCVNFDSQKSKSDRISKLCDHITSLM